MRILISNDDGYLAPGIEALAECAGGHRRHRGGRARQQPLGRVQLAVAGPAAVGVSRPPMVFISSTARPTDCVHIALTGMLDHRPDLVVSGINNGQNMGDDTLYSGTVAAATEAYLFGIPAIAFSQVAARLGRASTSAARVARDIVLRRFDALHAPFLLNVNIPNLPYEQMGPLDRRPGSGRRHQSEPVIRAPGPARARDLLDRRARRLPRCRRGHRFPRHRPGPGLDHAAAGRPDPPRPTEPAGGAAWHERKAQHLSLCRCRP